MPRLCARPGCSAPATATFTFDGLRRIVWLAPLADAAAYSAGDLCRRHTELFRAPRNWELRDVRPAPGTTEPSGAPAPSRFTAPTPVPVAASVDRSPAPAERPAARSTHPLLSRTAPRDVGPPVTTPLLSRAFRNAG